MDDDACKRQLASRESRAPRQYRFAILAVVNRSGVSGALPAVIRWRVAQGVSGHLGGVCGKGWLHIER